MVLSQALLFINAWCALSRKPWLNSMYFSTRELDIQIIEHLMYVRMCKSRVGVHVRDFGDMEESS